MPKFHVVTLDEAQRMLLEGPVRSGTASARTVTRARIRLKSDTGEFGPGWIDPEIADALDLGLSIVEQARKRDSPAQSLVLRLACQSSSQT
jgi:hypothetical protein